MKAILSTLGTLAIIVIVVIVTVDVASTPTAIKGQCLLTKRIILPDICANSCNPPFDCTTSLGQRFPNGGISAFPPAGLSYLAPEVGLKPRQRVLECRAGRFSVRET
jgi:hypothetical protein